MRYLFRKHQRVLRGGEFTLTLRRGSCAADDTLVLFVTDTEPGRPARLGVTIPKKVGNAVVRNQWKRWIRESFRTQQDQIPRGHDYIIRPKKDAQPNWATIKKSVPKLAQKAVARKK